MPRKGFAAIFKSVIDDFAQFACLGELNEKLTSEVNWMPDARKANARLLDPKYRYSNGLIQFLWNSHTKLIEPPKQHHLYEMKTTALELSTNQALRLSNMIRNQFDDETSVQVYVTYEQLFGKKKSLPELESELLNLDYTDLIHFTTRLGLTLQCDSGAHSFNYQIEIAQHFLPRKIYQRYSLLQLMRHALAKAKNKNFSVAPLVTPIHVLNFLKHIFAVHSSEVLNCKKLEGSTENASKAFELLLAFADHLTGSSKLSPDFIIESQQAIQELTRSTLLLQNEPYARTIGRYFRMCMEISETVPRHPTLPTFKQLFQRSTALLFEDFFAAGVALVSNYERASIFPRSANDNLDISARINWDNYFKNSSWTKEISDGIQTAYCTDVNEYKQKLKQPSSESTNEAKETKQYSFEYLLLPFKQKPLIRIDQDTVPIHFPYLIEKFTASTYWACFDNLEREETGAFNDYWGLITQSYVEQIFKNFIVPNSRIRANDLYIDVPYIVSKQKMNATDIIIFDKRFAELVFLEITYSNLREETSSLLSNLDSLSQGMDKILAKAKQINRVIGHLKNGDLKLDGLDPSKIRTFRPIVVTLHPFPVWNFLWHSYEGVSKGFYERLREANLLQGNDIAEFRIVSVSEIETLAALQRGRIDCLSVLRAWTESSRWSHEPFKNFLVESYSDKGNYEVFDQNYRKAIEFSASRLFSN